MKLNTKKALKYIVVFICVVVLYWGGVSLSYSVSDAEYLYDSADNFVGIRFNNKVYTDKSMPDKYDLIVEDITLFPRRYYIKYGDLSDYITPFSDFFCLYNREFDKYNNVIIESPNDSKARIYINKEMVLPILNRNKVDMVCMSLDAKDEDNIKDKETVDKIVECAKSNGEIELDKDIYDYIKKYSADHHCLWLKYEGYPIVEEFHIKETEDGRYIIDQYTLEEYDTIYWEEEAHQ